MNEIVVDIMCISWIAYLYMDYRIQKKTFYEEGFSPLYLFRKWRKKEKFVSNNWSENDRDFYDVETTITEQEANEIKLLITQAIEEKMKNLDFSDGVEKFAINDDVISIDIKFNEKE